jgi:hypothetical protein
MGCRRLYLLTKWLAQGSTSTRLAQLANTSFPAEALFAACLSIQAGELILPVLLGARRPPDLATAGDRNRTRCYQNEIRDSEAVRV